MNGRFMNVYNCLRVYACTSNLKDYIEGKGDLFARAEIALAHLSLHYKWRQEGNAKLIEIHDKFIKKMLSKQKFEDQVKVLRKSNEMLEQESILLDEKLGVLFDYAKEFNMLNFNNAPELYDGNPWVHTFIGERFDETNQEFKTATETLFKWFEKECSKEIDKVRMELVDKQIKMGDSQIGQEEQTRRQNNIADMDKILGK